MRVNSAIYNNKMKLKLTHTRREIRSMDPKVYSTIKNKDPELQVEANEITLMQYIWVFHSSKMTYHKIKNPNKQIQLSDLHQKHDKTNRSVYKNTLTPTKTKTRTNPQTKTHN